MSFLRYQQRTSVTRSAGTQPVPEDVYGWRPYALAAAASLGAANGGYNAFIGSAIHLPSFQRAFNLTPADITDLSARVMALFHAGAFFGSIVGYFLGERFGRKICIISTTFFTIVAAVMQLVAGGNLSVLYLARVLMGFSIGAKIPVLPAYIAEIAPATIRGRLVGMIDIFAMSAQVVGFWVSYAVQRHISPDRDLQWRIPFALQTIPAGLLMLAMSFAVESPRWLVDRKRVYRARESLAWVRHLPLGHENVELEISEMQKQAEEEDLLYGQGRSAIAARWKELTAKNQRRRIILLLLLKTANNLCGIDMLTLYGPQIFHGLGFTSTSSKLFATGIYGCVKAGVNAVFVVFFLDSIGRRRPLMIGSVIMVTSLVYLGVWTQTTHSSTSPIRHDAGAYVAAVAIYLYTAGYSISWAIVPFVFGSEIFPTRVRALALMMVFVVEWGLGFGVMYAVPYMIEHITFGTFYTFASCVGIGGVGVWLFMPETKGIELEKVGLLFEGPIWARHARLRANEKMKQAAGNEVQIKTVENRHDGEKPTKAERRTNSRAA